MSSEETPGHPMRVTARGRTAIRSDNALGLYLAEDMQMAGPEDTIRQEEVAIPCGMDIDTSGDARTITSISENLFDASEMVPLCSEASQNGTAKLPYPTMNNPSFYGFQAFDYQTPTETDTPMSLQYNKDPSMDHWQRTLVPENQSGSPGILTENSEIPLATTVQAAYRSEQPLTPRLEPIRLQSLPTVVGFDHELVYEGQISPLLLSSPVFENESQRFPLTMPSTPRLRPIPLPDVGNQDAAMMIFPVQSGHHGDRAGDERQWKLQRSKSI